MLTIQSLQVKGRLTPPGNVVDAHEIIKKYLITIITYYNLLHDRQISG